MSKPEPWLSVVLVELIICRYGTNYKGHEFVKVYHVEHLIRDAKITEIYEGRPEILQTIIGRENVNK